MIRWANMACYLAVVAIALAGCSTTKTYTRFNHRELQRLPPVSWARVLRVPSAGERTRYFNLVRIRGRREKLRVRAFRPPDLVEVEGRDGRTVVVRFRELAWLERVRVWIRPRDSGRMTASDVAEIVAYAPMLALAPIGLVANPIMAEKDEDKRKAQLAYEGMTREQVRRWLGEPARRYLCRHWIGRRYSKSEVWVYPANHPKVLRGGRVLHFGLDPGEPIFGKVYHVSLSDIWKNRPECRDLPSKTGVSAGGKHP